MLDVCEIGEAVGYTGQVKQVKVLGVMALLNEGSTDWKIIAIDVNDPLANKLYDIEDVERHLLDFCGPQTNGSVFTRFRTENLRTTLRLLVNAKQKVRSRRCSRVQRSLGAFDLW